MRIRLKDPPPKPETTHGLHVRLRRWGPPTVQPVDVIRYSDKTIWVWTGYGEEKRARHSLEDRYYLASEFKEAHAFADRKLREYVEQCEKNLEEAEASLRRLDKFKARGYKLKRKN